MRGKEQRCEVGIVGSVYSALVQKLQEQELLEQKPQVLSEP